MKLTNKAISIQRPQVSLDGERIALLDRDEVIDIILDDAPHTLAVYQPFSKKATITVRQADAYVIKGNLWDLMIHLMATAMVLFASLSPLLPIQMSFGLALTVMILAVLINVASLFFVSLYRIEPMEETRVQES